ncbi:MAG: ANTAR domain-containing protein [Oscillospiraceae bacterium]|nr:ANTAR domain-containing protein [Oscillospiraceae bacterium]
MDRIFINAKTEIVCETLAAALEDFRAEITCCFDDDEAAAADLSGYDLVIVSTPLRSEFGLNFVADVRSRTDAIILVLAKTEIADEVQNRIKFTGAYVLPRPFSKQSLIQTIKMAVMAKENMQRLEQEKSKLTKQLDDVKTIDRAKCCLIEYLNLTENQAHRHIQKLAMDTRRTQREIAEDILRTYSGITNV